jgi:Protein of unknown function (DUF3551)
MRTLAQLAVTAALALLVHVAPSDAHEAITATPAQYCLNYNDGGTDCGFTSLAQCNATASGIGAECSADFADDGRRMPHTFR